MAAVITAKILSAPKLAASTDYLVAAVNNGAADGLTYEFSLSPGASSPTAVWHAAQENSDGVRLLIGPESPVGRLPAGTWWLHIRIAGLPFAVPVILAGPFVIVGSEITDDDLILDGGAP